MNVDLSKIEESIIKELKITSLQAKIFLLVTIRGKMTSKEISAYSNISSMDAEKTCRELIEFGAFIDYGNSYYEAMHPRFTAVNMYRKNCEREGKIFGRNKVVDNIGVVLERFYDDARTK